MTRDSPSDADRCVAEYGEGPFWVEVWWDHWDDPDFGTKLYRFETANERSAFLRGVKDGTTYTQGSFVKGEGAYAKSDEWVECRE
jgi:hypothetical protein